jgi:hypothetical protein
MAKSAYRRLNTVMHEELQDLDLPSHCLARLSKRGRANMLVATPMRVHDRAGDFRIH